MRSWTIERCDLERVLPLRARITFDNKRDMDACVFPGDLFKQAKHWVAVSQGRDIAMASLTYSPKKVLNQKADWLLQFLGVDEEYRGAGIGRELIGTRLEEVRAAGSKFAWCSARVEKVLLYESLGALRESFMYDFPLLGLHVDMLYGPLL